MSLEKTFPGGGTGSAAVTRACALEQTFLYADVALHSVLDRPDGDIYRPFFELFDLFDMDARDARLTIASLRLMERSKDPLHTAAHPSSMARDYLNFIDADPTIKTKTDGAIVTLGIAMHDLWWSLQRPTIAGVAFGYLYEGKYAPVIAKKMMLRHGYTEAADAEKMGKILTVIGEHTLTTPKSSIESQWLYGLDCLELLQQRRMKDLEAYFRELSQSYLFRPAMYLFKEAMEAGAETFEYEVEIMRAIAQERGPAAKKMFAEVLQNLGV